MTIEAKSNVRPIRPEAPLPPPDGVASEREAAAAATAETEYRRRRRPVPVRQPHRDWPGYVRRGWKPALGVAVAVALGYAAYGVVFQSSWFVLSGSDAIAVAGARRTSVAEVQAVFASDLGRNVFFIPLEARRRAVQSIPWVRQAAVLRLWPNRLQVTLHERTPVAFARAGSRLDMIDADGVLLQRPRAGNYNFPVLSGLVGVNAAQPDAASYAAARRAQVAQWIALKDAVDAGSSHASSAFSEVNLSDAANIRVRVSLPGGASVLVALGDANLGPRYQLFQSQIGGWRQKYPNLISVDLHFDGQAIVDPGNTGVVTPAAVAPAPPAAKHARGKHP